MKNKKLLLALVAVLVLCTMVLTGCGKKDDGKQAAGLKGNWVLTEMSMGGQKIVMKDLGAEVIMIFSDDKAGTVTIKDNAGVMGSGEFPFTFADGKLTIEGDPADCTISGNTMKVNQGGIVMTLERK